MVSSHCWFLLCSRANSCLTHMADAATSFRPFTGRLLLERRPSPNRFPTPPLATEADEAGVSHNSNGQHQPMLSPLTSLCRSREQRPTGKTLSPASFDGDVLNSNFFVGVDCSFNGSLGLHRLRTPIEPKATLVHVDGSAPSVNTMDCPGWGLQKCLPQKRASKH